jgi:tRNA pseudouridine38-40 synthase
MNKERNIRLVLSYDGSVYHGFQIQPNRNTIQQVLQEGIESLVGHPVHIIGSGRTDAGVHARGQVVNFRTMSGIPVERWVQAINSKLPSTIVVKSVDEVPLDFHARKSAKRKTYRYSIRQAETPDVFHRRWEWHIRKPLDVALMKKAAKLFLGEHDFTSFCSVKTEIDYRVRTIYRSEWIQQGEVLHYFVEGSGFLYNMVRIIVGTMVEIGEGKRTVDKLQQIVEARDRRVAGPTAPSDGLILWEVKYTEE